MILCTAFTRRNVTKSLIISSHVHQIAIHVMLFVIMVLRHWLLMVMVMIMMMLRLHRYLIIVLMATRHGMVLVMMVIFSIRVTRTTLTFAELFTTARNSRTTFSFCSVSVSVPIPCFSTVILFAIADTSNTILHIIVHMYAPPVVVTVVVLIVIILMVVVQLLLLMKMILVMILVMVVMLIVFMLHIRIGSGVEFFYITAGVVIATATAI
uniref:Uncharacterized protein n=1 Tax=Anopheles darlingi TaxID=43151 RepID=A0A2M4CW73_ANODA